MARVFLTMGDLDPTISGGPKLEIERAMNAWMSREPVVLIGSVALAMACTLGILLESFGVEESAQATVVPEPVKLPEPEPLPALPNLGFKPLGDAATSPWPPDGRPTLMTFIQISDTHVGREGDHLMFDRAIEAINALRPAPEFVIITGDLTDSFTPAQIKLFRSQLRRVQPPTYIVPGNHDVMFDPTSKRILWWEKEFPRFKTPFRIDHGPMTLIGVDSQLWNARRKSRSANGIAEAQWAEMESMMREAQAEGQRIFVFDHIPAVPTFYRKRISRSWKTDRMHAFLKMLSTYEVEAELSGHVHRDELYVKGETLFLSAPPISEKYTRLPSIRLYRVTGEGLMYRQIYLKERGGQLLDYEMDLHHVDETAYRDWVSGMSEEDLAELWHYRHAGEEGGERWFLKINKALFRAYLEKPFDFQPERGMNSRNAVLGRRLGLRLRRR